MEYYFSQYIFFSIFIILSVTWLQVDLKSYTKDSSFLYVKYVCWNVNKFLYLREWFFCTLYLLFKSVVIYTARGPDAVAFCLPHLVTLLLPPVCVVRCRSVNSCVSTMFYPYLAGILTYCIYRHIFGPWEGELQKLFWVQDFSSSSMALSISCMCKEPIPHWR